MQSYRFCHFKQSLKTNPRYFSTEVLNDKFALWVKKYEHFIGLSEVKAAQTRVLEAEKRFVKAQESRRDIQRLISGIQQKLHELHVELDRIPRGDDKYLALVTQEHSVIKEEKRLKEEFQQIEKEEREHFSILSHTVRDSHEKERAQAEKTKYWSIIGSVVGTMFGIFGTTINNHLKMKELRSLVEQTAQKGQVEYDLESIREISKTIQQLSVPANGMPIHTVSKEMWGNISSALEKITTMYEEQQNTLLDFKKGLDFIFSPPVDDLNLKDNANLVLKPFVESILEEQAHKYKQLLFVACIIVPTFTLVISKFL